MTLSDNTVSGIMEELRLMGSEQIKKVFVRHGAREPFFGVKVGDMKTIVKRLKKNYELSLALFDTGNSDAMYLAGLIADEKKMTQADLQKWAENAYWYMISEFTVAWIAAESEHGWELGNRWIQAEQENIAASGWATLSSWMALTPDSELDLEAIRAFLKTIQSTIHESPNRVRYTMNGFVIAVATYVEPLLPEAQNVAQSIGKVSVQMGKTACKVPFAPDYIENIIQQGRVGKKKKMVRC
jgi:3-methyladenine DNA glycosylase AlkD